MGAILWTLLLTLLSSHSFAQEYKRLRVVTSDYPPYQGQGLPDGGIFDNLALLILKEAGYNVDLVYRPWKRALKESEEGDADAILGMWENPGRRIIYDFSPPLIENSLVLICLEKKSFCKNSPILKGKKLGLVLGYAYPDLRLFNAVMEYELTENVNIKKLLGERIDFVLVDRGVAYYLLQQQDPHTKIKVKMLEPAIAIQNLHIGFSKNSLMGRAAAIETPKILKKLEQNGKLKPLRMEAQKRGIKIFRF
ncbi:substrate-binding periplasmic protein [Bdellovibrio sp. HCB2-146]|uniref:substrate-binding periplasmic protein n=1 Tax=Bdellovibrio sp. HCB2-146 TaxID=3394362 RepID=UPI0039BC3486